jgi:DNA (cytosine-5)-methyltransferase 1
MDFLNPKESLMSKATKYFSMFSGVGGFELGIGDMGECIGYSEIDKYSIMTYERHYEHRNYGDATTINEQELPDFDLLVGGFPCQAFSVAGKRKGFDDTRGTLFFDIARIIKHKRPAHLVLENVQGLLSHDSGKTFQTILGVLADLGYGVEWQILNGKRWVPQNRVRVIIIGHLRERCTRKVLPLRQANEGDVEMELRHHTPQTVSPAIRTPNGGHHIPTITRQPLRFLDRNQRNIDGDYAYTVDASQTSGIAIHPTIDANYYKGQSNQRKAMQQGTRIRRLTPLECERLMGWPDNWTEGVSDTQRYKQCGNGIIAPMVEAIIKKLQPCLTDATDVQPSGGVRANHTPPRKLAKPVEGSNK